MVTTKANLKTVTLSPLTVRVSDDIVLTIFEGDDGNFYVADEVVEEFYEPNDELFLDPEDDPNNHKFTDRDVLSMFVTASFSHDNTELLRRGIDHPVGVVNIGVLVHLCEVLGTDRPKCRALMEALNSLTYTKGAVAIGLGEYQAGVNKLFALCLEAERPHLPSLIAK